jgi:thiamine-monophosphate kinase
MAAHHSALGGGAEFDFIRRVLFEADADNGAMLAARGVVVGPGDDCAVVRGGEIALTADLAIEDIHFRRTWITPEEIGYRAAAAALSDLAASAAEPVGVLASLAVPAAERDSVGLAVMRGVRAAARSVGAALIGGDVTRSPGPIIVDVVAVGHVTTPLLRSGARPGDELWVTGALGGAAAAVRAWRAGAEPHAAARHAYAHPSPRTREVLWLRTHADVHAGLDISDGLAGDAGHLAAASDVAVVIDSARVPLHEAVRAGNADAAAALHLALTGGDDYELLLACAPGSVAEVAAAFTEEFGVPLTCIGGVQAGSGVLRRSADGSIAPLDLRGYDHFAESEP